MEGWYAAGLAAARLATGLLGVRTRVAGLEHLPRTGPVLVVATHVAYADFVPIVLAARRRGRNLRFLTRVVVWTRWTTRALDGMGHVPVDRAAPAAAYLRARRLLLDGHGVALFPEAGISHSYAVRALMPGWASLARETGVPVVPVALWGTQRIYTVGRLVDGQEIPPDRTRGRLVDVRFGPALRVAPDEDPRAATDRLGHVLTAMLEELQLLPEHRPGPTEYAPWYPAHLGGHAPDRREALGLDDVPRSAVQPTWGPPLEPPALP